MRRLFAKLFGARLKWNLKKADFTESTKELHNPARGWYQIYTFYADKTPDLKNLTWCQEDKDSLVFILLDISAYREKNLDDTALNNIRSILEFFSKSKYDIVLRAVYDHDGNAVEREPFFFSQVQNHLKQMTKLIQEFSDAIFVFQGMLIGNWGEMHTSRFLTPEKMAALFLILKNELKDEVFLAVRRPGIWRQLHPEGCGKIELPYDSMGLFDDAIFGSDSHLGTFGNSTKEMAGWDGLWCREDELLFEEKLCQRVPNGGEAIYGETYLQTGNPLDTIDTLKKMHITYLNKAYDKRILDIWKEWIWEEAGVWQNKSVYEYIGMHLGYRFWIKDAAISATEKNAAGDKLQVTITIANTGFANFYQEAEVKLEWLDTQGNWYSAVFKEDMRTWNSDCEHHISCETDATDCKLYLSAKRRSDGRPIYFANQSKQDGRVYLGEITACS